MGIYFDVICFTLGGLIGLLICTYFKNYRKIVDLSGKHIVIVGGSVGIGYSIAEQAVKKGASVTIVARNESRLEKSKEALNLLKCDSKQNVLSVAMDISVGAEVVEEKLRIIADQGGAIDMLVCCAGTAICGRLEDMSSADIKYLTDLNFLGSVWLTRAILPSMKSRGSGSIVLVSSGAALLGVYGYSAYGATKWAVRGLGEALLMETVGTGVSVTIAFPPDTDTPGFELENASKPQETKIISGSAGLCSPDVVAEQIIKDAANGQPYSTVGLESWMLAVMCCCGNLHMPFVFLQSIFMGSFRIVLYCYQMYFEYVINTCRKEKNQHKKTK